MRSPAVRNAVSRKRVLSVSQLKSRLSKIAVSAQNVIVVPVPSPSARGRTWEMGPSGMPCW
jgi:hypothetical protein